MPRRNSFMKWWRDFRWPIIGASGVLAVCLGHIGFATHYVLVDDPRSFSDALYLSLQLFTMKSGFIDPPVPWELEVARLLAPAVAAFAAIQALAAVFRDHFQLVRLRFWKDHVVLCGLGEKGFALAKAFRECGDRVVVIERDALNSFAGRCRGPKAVVLAGDATDMETLRKAGVERSRLLVSVCGEDGTNAEVGVNAREMTKDRSGEPLSVIVHIVDVELCGMLQSAMPAGMPGAAMVDFFNVYEAGARTMLGEWPPFSPNENSREDSPRMIVVGMGRLGRNLVVHAARDWHFTRKNESTRLRIACIDRDAAAKVRSLSLRNPGLEGACDLQALQMDVTSPEFEEGAFLFGPQGRCDVSAAYVCFDDDARSLATALKIHRRLGANNLPIVIRMVQLSGLARLLHCGVYGPRPSGSAVGKKVGEGGPREDFGNMHAFGLLDRTCRPDLLFAGNVEKIARAIHEAYVLQQKGKGFSAGTNPSMVDWDDLPDSLKKSNRHQARDIDRKLKDVGCRIVPFTDWSAELVKFTPEEVEIMATMEHDRWCEERLRSGWSYAPGPKDIVKKTSPHLITWEGLSEEIKEYDRNTVREMPIYLARVGYRIFRIKGK
ncbi:MAG: hypothetical protein C4529_04855 [Deltaproteobacteria bacterium]|nr:MAG: hypothetical protein C4529_04855 [Deltaproteobacteria bacterium]